MKICPICTSSFATYLPLPTSYFELINCARPAFDLDEFETLNCGQYLCPTCGASDRERLMALYLQNWFTARSHEQPPSILEIAPSVAFSRYLRSWPIRYRSADLMSPLADDWIDITDMHIYGDASFDLVICSHVLEHIPDDLQAMREIRRVLRHGGALLALVPIPLRATKIDEDSSLTDVAERWRRFGQDDHVRMYARDDFIQRLESAGFAVELISSGRFEAEKVREAALTSTSTLYVCHA